MPPVSGVSILLALGTARRTVALALGVDADTYKLNFGGQKTVAIRKDATYATVQADLEALSTIGAGNVLVQGAVYGPFVVTFRAALAGQDVGALTASDITGGALTVTILDPAGNALKTLTVASGADSDSYKLNYGGQKTTAIRKDDTAATIEEALEALSSINGENVTVTGPVYGPFLVTFVGTLAQRDATAITVTDITGGTLTVTPADYPAYVSLGGQRKTDFNRSVSEADATNKDTFPDHAGAPMVRESVVACDSFVLESDADYLAMEQAYLNGALLRARLGMPSGAVYSADAVLLKAPIAGPHDNLATIAIEVKISGLLTKV